MLVIIFTPQGITQKILSVSSGHHVIMPDPTLDGNLQSSSSSIDPPSSSSSEDDPSSSNSSSTPLLSKWRFPVQRVVNPNFTILTEFFSDSFRPIVSLFLSRVFQKVILRLSNWNYRKTGIPSVRVGK